MEDRSPIRLGMLAMLVVASCGGRSLSMDAGPDAGGAGGGSGGAVGPGRGGAAGPGLGGGGGAATGGQSGFGGTSGSGGRGGTSFSTGGTSGTGGVAGTTGGRGGSGGTFSTGGTSGTGGVAGTMGGRGGTSGTGGTAGTMGGRGGTSGTVGRGGIGGTAGSGGTGGAPCATCRATLLPLEPRDIVYDPVRNQIYATIIGNADAYPNTIVVVDPWTSSVVSSIQVGSNPGALALSDDGSTLWVGIDGARAFRKVTLTSTPPALGPLHHLPKANPDGFYSVTSMAALPGAPLSVAIGMSATNAYGYGYGVAEIRVFDDGVPRATGVKNTSSTPSFIVAGPPGYLFGAATFAGEFFVLPVSASGITQTPFSGLFFNRPANMVYTGGRVYGSSGEVIDVANPAAPVRTTSLAYNGYSVAVRDPQTLLMIGTDFTAIPMAKTVVRVLSTSPPGLLASAPLPTNIAPNAAGGYSKLVYAGGDAVAFLKSQFMGSSEPPRLVVMHDPAFGTPTGGTGGIGGTGGTGGGGGTGGVSDPCPGCSFVNVTAYGQHLAHDPSRGLIYVAADATAALHPSSIVTVDAATGAKASVVPVGNDPQPLALSDDRSVLWVGLAGERRVRRMTPGTTPVPGAAYSLPMLLTTGEPSTPHSVSVLPGTASSIAVGVHGGQYGGGGVFILDDGLPRANWVQPPEVLVFSLANGPAGSLIGYGGYGSLIVFQLGMFGATMETHDGLLATGYYIYQGSLTYQGGYVYATSGDVIDFSNPNAPLPAGKFAFNNCGLAVRSATRVLMLCPNEDYQRGPILRVLDTNAFVQVGSVRLPDSLAGIALSDLTYLGGDAVAYVGSASGLGIMHAPIIGSPP